MTTDNAGPQDPSRRNGEDIENLGVGQTPGDPTATTDEHTDGDLHRADPPWRPTDAPATDDIDDPDAEPDAGGTGF